MLLLAVAALCVHPAPARAQSPTIDIEETLWGFSGRVLRGQFNPLSIRISNPTSEPREGTLRIQKTADGVRMIGAVYEVDYYLSPFASRWVQIHPYCVNVWEEWKLWWGDGEDRQMLLPKPRFGPPEPVLLVAGPLLTASGVAIKRFPDELWPPAVSGTHALKSVVLDHVPQWEDARRQSFLDWLHAGGTVHLVRDSNGRFPVFPERLADLNLPSDRRSLGDGLILRHDAQLSQIEASRLESAVTQWGLAPTSAPTAASAQPARGRSRTDDRYRELASRNASTSVWGGDEAILSRLRSITRPRRNWILIYALSLAYLGGIFPGCYLLGRTQSDWRFVYAALLACVLFFTWLLFLVGRRSDSEPLLVRSVGIARPVAAGGYDVVQWSDVAVSTSDRFELTHNGTGRIYSTCEELMPVDATIYSGPESRLEITIPPFSSQGFTHRVRLAARPMQLSVTDFLVVGGRVQQIELEPGDGFPIDLAAFPDPEKIKRHRRQPVPEPSLAERNNFGMFAPRLDGQLMPLVLSPFRGDPQQVYVLYADRLYRMRAESGRLMLAGSAGSVAGLAVAGSQASVLHFDPDFDPQAAPDEVFHSLCGQLISRSLDLQGDAGRADVVFPRDRMRVFVYAPMPAELRLQSPGFENQEGYMLYVHDIPVSETP